MDKLSFTLYSFIQKEWIAIYLFIINFLNCPLLSALLFHVQKMFLSFIFLNIILKIGFVQTNHYFEIMYNDLLSFGYDENKVVCWDGQGGGIGESICINAAC